MRIRENVEAHMRELRAGLEHEMQALREAGFAQVEAIEAIAGATIIRAQKA